MDSTPWFNQIFVIIYMMEKITSNYTSFIQNKYPYIKWMLTASLWAAVLIVVTLWYLIDLLSVGTSASMSRRVSSAPAVGTSSTVSRNLLPVGSGRWWAGKRHGEYLTRRSKKNNNIGKNYGDYWNAKKMFLR